MKKLFAVSLFASVAAVAACVPVTGDRILGSDLVATEPAMAGLPASLILGFAPLPGEKRIFKVAELLRVARSNRIAVDELSDICFELPVRLVAKEEIIAAMTRVLPPSVQLEIVELGKAEAPAGTIEFPLTAMEPADVSGVRMWRGSIRYLNTRKIPLWARVKVQNLVAAPLSVRRGETIRVEVASGWARLHFEAVAESDAHEGELVALRNPVSGKTFRARVGPGGKATIVVGGPAL